MLLVQTASHQIKISPKKTHSNHLFHTLITITHFLFNSPLEVTLSTNHESFLKMVHKVTSLYYLISSFINVISLISLSYYQFQFSKNLKKVCQVLRYCGFVFYFSFLVCFTFVLFCFILHFLYIQEAKVFNLFEIRKFSFLYSQKLTVHKKMSKSENPYCLPMYFRQNVSETTYYFLFVNKKYIIRENFKYLCLENKPKISNINNKKRDTKKVLFKFQIVNNIKIIKLY